MKPEEVEEVVTSLRNESGEEIKKLRKFWHTENPSIQGTWNPFLNRPPSLRKHIRNKVDSANDATQWLVNKIFTPCLDSHVPCANPLTVEAASYRTGFIVIWSSGQNLHCKAHNTFLSIIPRVDGFLVDVKPTGSKVTIQRLAFYWLVVISGGSRGGARGGQASPLFWVKKKKWLKGSIVMSSQLCRGRCYEILRFFVRIL